VGGHVVLQVASLMESLAASLASECKFAGVSLEMFSHSIAAGK